MLLRTLAAIYLCLLAQLALAEANDHPLLHRYPGADVRYWLYTEYERTEMPAGPVDHEGRVAIDTLVGDLTRITYEIEGVSTLKVFENYKQALKKAGATFLSTCELEACGEADSELIDLANGVSGDSYVGNYYRKPYFLRAQLESARGPIHVFLFAGGFKGDVWLQQVIIEESPLEDGLIAVDESYLAAEVEKTGSGDQRTPEERQQDHPMIARYPGAELTRSRHVEYEKILLPLGKVNSDGIASEEMDLIGDLHQFTYETRNVSTLKVYRNYLQAVKELGFFINYSCELDACGNERESVELAERLAVAGDVQNYFRKSYYFVATQNTPQGRVVVAFYFGGFEGDVWVQQAMVEEKGAATDLVRVDADQLYQDIQNTGKALVYGIYFDTDSANVKDNSAEALKAISDLLASHPELDLYVVGHTDDTGDGGYNLNLSSRRAASVVGSLTKTYSVGSDRLKPAGVGPYAPVAGNESEADRALNRRVELVRRL